MSANTMKKEGGKYTEMPPTNGALKQLMQRRQMSRRELALAIGKPLNSAKGYSNGTIDKWLSGERLLRPEMLFYIQSVIGSEK